MNYLQRISRQRQKGPGKQKEKRERSAVRTEEDEHMKYLSNLVTRLTGNL